MSELTLQPILGTDKNNQCFSVFKSTDDPTQLEVYFGMALLEKVNNDGTSLLFKMLVGRLYNSRIKVKTLEEAFGLHRSTFRPWGEVLNCGDDNEIIRVLSSSGCNKKITPEIDRFVRSEFQRIYPDDKYTYSSVIREKIKDIFDVELSSEALRSTFNEEKEKLTQKEKECRSQAATDESPSGLEPDVEAQEWESYLPYNKEPESEERSDEYSDENISTQCKVENEEDNPSDDVETGVSICDSEEGYTSTRPDNRKHSLPIQFPEGTKQLFHHAGLMILLSSILKIGESMSQKIVLQWISTVLLGAKNIEQTGSLDLSSLSIFLNQNIIKSLKHQRFCLKRVCTPEMIREVLKANISFCGPSEHNIVYYDPHSIPYTGLKKILKGWCGSVGKTTKVNYHDFIHNFKGEPLWFESFDNYSDLRERFTGVLSSFAEAAGLLPQQLTTIVDRGIYGKKRMEAIHKAGFGLVTWQKNYTDKFWDGSKKITRFPITRCRNNSRDRKLWLVEFYSDKIWNTVEGYHRIIVKVLAPGKKKPALLSILSNGKCSDYLAVYAMLNRWIQENDFAYLIRHFGINMITTYDSELYSEIEEEPVEKETYTDAYLLVKKAVASTEGKIKTILMRREEKEVSGKSLSAKDKARLDELKQQLNTHKEELESIDEKQDKYTKLSENGTRRLKLEPKVLMDAVKIVARNIFYSHVEPFRKHYNNYRNDHTIFRELTRAPGYVSRQNGVICVELKPARNFEPKELRLIQHFFEKLNSGTELLRFVLDK